MSPVISVPAGALDVAGAAESLASLPETYRVGVRGGLSVGAVSGTEWMGDAQNELARGRDGVLAVPDAGASQRAVSAALRESRRPVVIDDRWSYSPGIAALSAGLDDVPDAELVEFSAHVADDDDIAGAFLDLLALADLVTGPLVSLSLASSGTEVMNATGHTADVRTILISVRRSAVGTGDARVRAVGTSSAVDAVLPGAATAAPATVGVYTGDGVVIHPSVYESGHRAAWLALARAVNTGTDVTDLARRARVTGLLEHAVVTEPPSNAGTEAGPANQEEKK